MKNLKFFAKSLVVVLGLTLNTVQAQTNTAIQVNIGSGGEGRQIIKTFDGNYAIVGTMNGNVALTIMKPDGKTKVFSKTYGGSGTDNGYGISQSPSDSSFYLAGMTTSFGGGIMPNYLLKIDGKTGNLILSKVHLGGRAVLATDDGGCITSFDPPTAVYGAHIAKTNKDGNIEWSYRYGDTTDYMNNCISICKNLNGFIVCSTHGVAYGIDENGQELWRKSYGIKSDTVSFTVNFIKEIPNGGAILVGKMQNTNQTFRNIYAVRININGDTLWTRKVVSINNRYLESNSVEVKNDGFIIVGYNDGGWNDYNNFIAKLDLNGNIVWSKNIVASDYTSFLSSIIASNDCYMSVGYNNGSTYLVKVDTLGNAGCNDSDAKMVSTSIQGVVTNIALAQTPVTISVINPATVESSATTITVICETVGFKEKEIPSGISVFPNPATDYIVVQGLKNSSLLRIFNSLGAIVLEKNITSNEDKISLSNFPTGMYIITIGNYNKKIIKY